jgi:hypothetical protein
VKPWSQVACDVAPTCGGKAEPIASRPERSVSVSWRPGDTFWASDARPLEMPGSAGLATSYPIRSMAAALGRTSATIRRLERAGVMPPAPYVRRGVCLEGDRRRYGRAHIEAAVRVAEEEGVLAGKVSSFAASRFSELLHREYDILASRCPTRALRGGFDSY